MHGLRLYERAFDLGSDKEAAYAIASTAHVALSTLRAHETLRAPAAGGWVSFSSWISLPRTAILPCGCCYFARSGKGAGTYRSRAAQSATVRRLYERAIGLGGSGTWPARFGVLQLLLEDIFGFAFLW